MEKDVKVKGAPSRAKKRMLFYSIMIALPVLQFAVFYIYVNFSFVLQAFQQYSLAPDGMSYTIKFGLFDNFKAVFDVLKTDTSSMVWTSILGYLVSLIIGTPLALFFSYYLYKKYFMSNFFKTMLFLPQLLSSVVLVILFKYMANNVYSALTGATGLLDNQDTRLGTILFFSVWISFGSNVLIYSGAMSGINDSVVESAQLDGATGIKEFISITLPMIFPTFATFLLTGIATIFSNQLNLYTFFQNRDTTIRTVGYYLYVQSLESDLVATSNGVSEFLSYPQISAFGLMITVVIFPIIAIVRRLLDKFGPSA